MLHKIGVSTKQLVLLFFSENTFPIFIADILGNGIGIGWLYWDIARENGNIFPFSYLIPWRYIITANVIVGIAIVLAIVGIYWFIKGASKNADNKRYNW